MRTSDVLPITEITRSLTFVDVGGAISVAQVFLKVYPNCDSFDKM